MPIRRWSVRPDVLVPTQQYGQVAAVSRGLIDQAFLDGAAMMCAAGGVFTVIAGRHPTDLPQESLTTGLICEWKDHTRASVSAEPQTDVLPAVEPDPEYMSREDWERQQEAMLEAAAAEAAGAEPAISPPDAAEVAQAIDEGADLRVEGASLNDSPDGLDVSQLEEEDVSEIPESVR